MTEMWSSSRFALVVISTEENFWPDMRACCDARLAEREKRHAGAHHLLRLAHESSGATAGSKNYFRVFQSSQTLQRSFLIPCAKFSTPLSLGQREYLALMNWCFLVCFSSSSFIVKQVPEHVGIHKSVGCGLTGSSSL